MKKIALIATMLTIATLCSACNAKTESTSAAPVETTIAETNTTATKEITTENLATTQQETNAQVNFYTLSDLENYLLDNNALSGKRTEMAADMVGAVNGFKYSEPKVEIYEYDINSNEYKTLSNGNEISLKGMENVTVKSTAINGKFVLFGDVPQNVIDAFNSYK